MLITNLQKHLLAHPSSLQTPAPTGSPTGKMMRRPYTLYLTLKKWIITTEKTKVMILNQLPPVAVIRTVIYLHYIITVISPTSSFANVISSPTYSLDAHV